MRKNWKTLKIGDRVTFNWDEFDGSGSITGQVEEIEPNHVIVEADGMHLWLDDDTEWMYSFED